MNPDSPDYSQSRAILIGTSTYQNTKDFLEVPAAANSLAGMWEALTNPDLCGWPESSVTALQNPVGMREVVRTLRRLARATEEVLLVYFVGHGVILPSGKLCLVLSDTDAEDPDISGLEFERVREALLNSPARLKIVVLDCCYSGRAIEALSADEIADTTDTRGVYTLTASDHAAHVPPLSQQANTATSFTAELLDLIRTGIPGGPEQLTLGNLYPPLRRRLQMRGLPAPNQRGTDTADQFPFTRNSARRCPEPQSQAETSAENPRSLPRARQNVFGQATAAVGAAAAFAWQAEAAAFDEAAVELIRRDDDVPVRRMLRSAQADASALINANNAPDLVMLLDRVTTVAALGLELGRPLFFTKAVALLLELYQSGLSPTNAPSADRLPVQQLWLRIAERLYGLGALAVREGDWTAVRALAAAPVPSLEVRSRQRTWHRHALTEAANSKLLEEPVPGRGTRPLSLLLLARAVVVNNSALRPDLPGEVAYRPKVMDPLQISLCQFDLLVTVVSGVGVNAASVHELTSVSYPNFGQFGSEYVGTIARPLITRTSERETLIPQATDEQVAIVLYLADQAAIKAGGQFIGWDGYHDNSVTQFIQEQVRLSDQELWS
jgi:hypothetical protein